jgi:ATP/maltotriose-dependent transcriptional regulator MalT
LPRVVVRERLLRCIDETESPAVWTAGPPGSGKSTLLASVIQARHVPYIWYTLDDGDADPLSVLHALAAAARAPPFNAGSLPALISRPSARLTPFARAYFRALFASFPPAAIIVLDNYEAAANPALDALLCEAISECPNSLRIMAAGQAGPPCALARLVANQRVALIDAGDLRLTREESDRIALLHAPLDEQALASLHTRTDG